MEALKQVLSFCTKRAEFCICYGQYSPVVLSPRYLEIAIISNLGNVPGCSLVSVYMYQSAVILHQMSPSPNIENHF